MVVASTKPSEPPKYAGDLSKSQSVEQVAWPRDRRSGLDLYYDVIAHGAVKLVLPDGRVFEHPVERVLFCRVGDGKRVTSITLVFEGQTIEEVYATAAGLGQDVGHSDRQAHRVETGCQKRVE
jgi:hypothetical protein